MKQTLLSLAALIGLAGAAKAQVKLGEEYTYTASVTIDENGEPSNETFKNFDDQEFGKTYLMTYTFTPISKELKKSKQLGIQGDFDGMAWHQWWGNDGIGDKVSSKMMFKCTKDDNKKSFKISVGNHWTETPLAGTYTATVTVKIIEQNMTPRGKVVYGGPDKTGEKNQQIMSIEIGAGKDVEKITEDTEIYIEYEGNEADIIINEAPDWGWVKLGNVFLSGIQKVTFADIEAGLSEAGITVDKLTKLVIADKDGSTKIKKITVYSGSSTPIANIDASDAEVVSTTYYSITGAASAEPAKGMNVVKEQLSDGNIRIRKIMVK